MDTTIKVPENLSRRHAGKTTEGPAALGLKWAETFEVLGGLTGTARVLDIGCGPGRMAIGIGERFGWTNPYFGFDIMPKEIRFCQNEISIKHPGFKFERLDVRNDLYNPNGTQSSTAVRFPVDDSSIDFAFATSVFTHMFADEVEYYVRETRRCLAPGGIFFSTWFILSEETKAAANPRFSFTNTNAKGAWVADPARPEEAVAYERGAIDQMMGRAGFASVTAYPGGWARTRTEARHAQDIVVAKAA